MELGQLTEIRVNVFTGVITAKMYPLSDLSRALIVFNKFTERVWLIPGQAGECMGQQ